jgi:hypothetical protein
MASLTKVLEFVRVSDLAPPVYNGCTQQTVTGLILVQDSP